MLCALFGKSMQNSIYFLIIFINNRFLIRKTYFFMYFRMVNNFFIKKPYRKHLILKLTFLNVDCNAFLRRFAMTAQKYSLPHNNNTQKITPHLYGVFY